MSFTQIIMCIGAIGFIYGLAKKPEWVAIVLFTSIVADVNFNVPVIPLNFRAIVSICLLVKVLGDKTVTYTPFSSLGYSRHILFFIVYVLAITAKNGLWNMDITKEFILNFVSAYLAYHFYFHQKGYQIFKAGIILGGLVCFGDLAYTYAFIGTFPVQRFYYLFLPGFGMYNHNFFGYICGASFVFLLSDYLNSETKTKINLFLLPVMFLGTLLSTSRSSLLLVVIFALVLIGRGLVSQNKGKKAYTLTIIIIACLFITLFIFQIIQSFIGNDSEFLEQITGRLIDEPMAMLNRAMGKNYVESNLDSMDWRAEASSIAYESYIHLPGDEQLFGIGYNGFLHRDYGHGYDAHNGILLMMIEFGIFGFLVYITLLVGLMFRAISLKLNSPFVPLLVYMILYVASHNKELTAFFCFLVTGSLVAQIRERMMAESAPVVRIRPAHN